MAKSQKHFPQLKKPDIKMHKLFDSIYLRFCEIRLLGFAGGSGLIPGELKRTFGWDGKNLYL